MRSRFPKQTEAAKDVSYTRRLAQFQGASDSMVRCSPSHVDSNSELNLLFVPVDILMSRYGRCCLPPRRRAYVWSRRRLRRMQVPPTD